MQSRNIERNLGFSENNLISHLCMRKLFIHAISQKSTQLALRNKGLRQVLYFAHILLLVMLSFHHWPVELLQSGSCFQ